MARFRDPRQTILHGQTWTHISYHVTCSSTGKGNSQEFRSHCSLPNPTLYCSAAMWFSRMSFIWPVEGPWSSSAQWKLLGNFLGYLRINIHEIFRYKCQRSCLVHDSTSDVESHLWKSSLGNSFPRLEETRQLLPAQSKTKSYDREL
jgi:hypothetical protein